MTIRLEAGRDQPITQTIDETDLLLAVLRKAEGCQLKLARYISRDTETVFNSLQMKDLLDDIQVLRGQTKDLRERGLLRLLEVLAKSIGRRRESIRFIPHPPKEDGMDGE